MGQSFPLRNLRIVGSAQAYPQLPPGVRTVLRAANLPGYVLADLDGPRTRRRSSRRR